jgi:heat shock protein HspQ
MKFEAGTKVRDLVTGYTGVVVDVVYINDGEEVVAVLASSIEAMRAFEIYDYVREIESGDIGIVVEDDGDPEDEAPYTVYGFEEDAEYLADAADLELWKPKGGEHVVEVGDEEEIGTVIFDYGTNIYRVLWEDYPNAQDWELEHLEPYFEEDDEEIPFQVGQRVESTNPFFNPGYTAKIVEVSDNGQLLSVIWERTIWNSGPHNGLFSADSFKLADSQVVEFKLAA